MKRVKVLSLYNEMSIMGIAIKKDPQLNSEGLFSISAHSVLKYLTERSTI